MKTIIILLLVSILANSAFAVCKAEHLQKDIEAIQARKDISYDDKKRDIHQAKMSFKDDVIECALNSEPISQKARMLAEKYIHDDFTTKPKEAKELLGLIEANTGDF